MADISEPPDEMLRALLDAEKACPEPPLAIAARVLSRLAAAVDLGPFAPSPPPGISTPSPTPAASSTIIPAGAKLVTHAAIKACAVFLAGAVAGVGGNQVVQRVAVRPRSPAAVEAPAPHLVPSANPPAVDPTLPTPPTLPAPLPAAEVPLPPPPPAPVNPPAPRPPAPRPRAAPPEQGSTAEARDDRLAAERNLLEVAHTALARGQSDGALSILHRHANLYPNGDLREEREGLLIQALVAHGDYGAARERAARFQERYPRSLFAPAIEQAIRSIP